MNRYPSWLNALVVIVLIAGILLAAPNIYGRGPAVQVALIGEEEVSEARLESFVRIVDMAGVDVVESYVKDGRAVLRFADAGVQEEANSLLRERLDRQASVAMTLAPKIPAWMRTLGLEPMSLGLDLRGGIYVLLEVDMASAVESRLKAYERDLGDRLIDERITYGIDQDDGAIRIRLRQAEDLELARAVVVDADRDLLVTDGTDGRSLLVRMSEQQIKERQDFAIEQNMTTLRSRVDQLGVAEPLVQRQGTDRIVVQLPGLDDPNEVDRILTATATLEFRLVDQSGTEPGSRRYPGRGDEPSVILKREVIASGDQIINAAATVDQYGQPAVDITLDASAGDEMLRTTQNNLNKPMSTVYIEWHEETVERNGVENTRRYKTEEVINTATIRGVFKNKFQITGLSTPEASRLAKLLRAGALAAPVYKVDDRTIGPSLGQENIDKGFLAIQIGFLAVIVFMAIYYRSFGLIANLALLSNLVFIVAILSLLGASLTLPGIAGIVLTVGMAVDANVLIFERIREEIAAGAGPQSAISAGYDKALSSIADANITTLIAAIVLFGLGTGPIKGFAITLSIGILTSMFTAIVGTRTVVNLLYGGRRIESVPV